MISTIELPEFNRLQKAISETKWIQGEGIVKDVVGLVIESAGPQACIGDWCQIILPNGVVDAEVVGFRKDRVLLMPLGDLAGISPGSIVRCMNRSFESPAGHGLLGRVLDGLGRPIDGSELSKGLCKMPTLASPPNAMERPPISKAITTGVKAIDGFLTFGEGQRLGIFAGSGVGKSTLMGMIACKSSADVNVICLVGERGRELREFIENDLGKEGLAKSVVVCATSDQPALVRIKAAFTATAIAEYFRNQGKSVLLVMDSVTRFAMAQREVGLSIGEPPSTKGYTPSVFALLPKLIERAGTSKLGSITGLYTVLVEGDDHDEPIADATRAILDGHIVLSRKLTSRGHYPPIDVLQSLSRTMPLVVTPEHNELARQGRETLAAYNDVEDLVSIGAYKTGSNKQSDKALKTFPALNSFLMQAKNESQELQETLVELQKAVNA